MRRLVLLDSAIQDITSIQIYITRESGNRTIGREFARQIRNQCEKLASLHGTIGRDRSELRADLRSFACKGYIIFFRYQRDLIEIVNVLEGHRDIEAYFRDSNYTFGGFAVCVAKTASVSLSISSSRTS